MNVNTTLTVEQVEPDLFALKLGTQTLSHYGSAEAASNYRALAMRDTDHLYDLVNERIELLLKSDNHLASVIRSKCAKLHQARRNEIRTNCERGYEVFVEFTHCSLHWETILTLVSDYGGEPYWEADNAFYCAIDPLGSWINAAEITADWSDSANEALMERAVEEGGI